MFYFEHPEAWGLLLLILLLAGLRWLRDRWRRQIIASLGDEALVMRQIVPATGAYRRRQWLLPLLAMLFAIAALADLRKRGKEEDQMVKGVEVMIALDISNSMLAGDVPPNRLSVAKQLAERLIRKLGGNRIGLIMFAGHAYQQVPLTDDVPALMTGLTSAEPGATSAQGTNITEAIGTAVEDFNIKAKAHKAMIIISDGEEHEPGAVSAARAAFGDEGIVIHTVGIGSPGGATITDPATGSPKTDEDGQPVVSKLDESLLRDIAQQAGGSYTLLRQPEGAASAIAGAINSMAGTPLRMARNTGYTSYYPWFALAALLSLLAGWVPANSKRRKPAATIAALVLLLLHSTSTPAQQRAIRQGNQHYIDKQYPDAAQRYRQALEEDSLHAIASYNLGNALWQSGDMPAAMQYWTRSLSKDTTAIVQSRAQYNLGNAAVQQQDWQSAVSRYTQALRRNPGDADAKYNLSYALRKLKEQQQQDQQNQQNQDKNKDQNKQQNKDQQDQQNKKDQNKDEQKDRQSNKQQDQNNQPQQGKDQQQQPQNKQGNQPQQSSPGNPQNDQQPEGRQPLASKLSAQQAAAMLNAVQQQERQTRDRMRRTKSPMSPGGKKDW